MTEAATEAALAADVEAACTAAGIDWANLRDL